MSTPLERAMIPAAEWGAKVDTTGDWADDWRYRPDCYIIHYGGGANPAGTPPYSQESESAVLRSWEHWHVKGRGWRALAYNYAVGQTGTIYVGRGEHCNGGQYGDWNRTSRAVVCILGGGQEPSVDMRRSLARLILEEPFSGKVLGHRDAGVTSCPGEPLYRWIRNEGFVTDLGVHCEGDYAPVIQSIKVRLHRLGYFPLPRYSPRFNAALRRRVQRFQRRHGLTPDGVVGPQTLRMMLGRFGEVYPDAHDDPTG